MRESGDPALLAEYQKIEGLRFDQIRAQMSPVLSTSGRLRAGVSTADAVSSIWAMTGTDLYNQLVSGRRWTPARYEEWLRDALTNMLLEPSTTTGTEQDSFLKAKRISATYSLKPKVRCCNYRSLDSLRVTEVGDGEPTCSAWLQPLRRALGSTPGTASVAAQHRYRHAGSWRLRRRRLSRR